MIAYLISIKVNNKVKIIKQLFYVYWEQYRWYATISFHDKNILSWTSKKDKKTN